MAIKFPQLKKTPKNLSGTTGASVSPYVAPTASMAGFNHEGLGPYNTSRFYAPTGRIGRIRYLLYPMGFAVLINLILFMVSFAIGGVANLTMAGSDTTPKWLFIVLGLLGLAVIPAMIYIVFALAVRRLNDLNRSGWLCLLFFIPVIQLILALYLIFAPGTPGRNDYGLPAPPPTMLMKVLTFVFIGLSVVGIIGAIKSISEIEKMQMAQVRSTVSKPPATSPISAQTATPMAQPMMPTGAMSTASPSLEQNNDIEKPVMVEQGQAPTVSSQGEPAPTIEPTFAQQPSAASQDDTQKAGNVSYEEFIKMSEGKVYHDPVRVKK